jgi:hypothetical protein
VPVGNHDPAQTPDQANVHGPLRVGLYPSREDWAEARAAAHITSSNHDDMHAGELETSILLAAYPVSRVFLTVSGRRREPPLKNSCARTGFPSVVNSALSGPGEASSHAPLVQRCYRKFSTSLPHATRMCASMSCTTESRLSMIRQARSVFW